MNCYSALTKEEALTTPPVTLAKGFVKRVCASLAFQPAGIDCSLPHGSLCPGRGRAVVARLGLRCAPLPTAASRERPPRSRERGWSCPRSFPRPQGLPGLLQSPRALESLRVEKTFKISKSNSGFSHSGHYWGWWVIFWMNGILIWRMECCFHNVSWLHLFIQYFDLLFPIDL